MLTNIFITWIGRLGFNKTVPHRVQPEKKDKQPIHSALYHAGLEAEKLWKKEKSWMLVNDVIGLTKAKWASLPVSVSKKDGTIRIFINYRKLKGLETWDSYFASHINDCIDSFGDAGMFSKLEGIAEYLPVESSRKVGKNPISGPITTFRSKPIPLSCIMGQKRFKKQWMFYWQESSANFPWSI